MLIMKTRLMTDDLEGFNVLSKYSDLAELIQEVGKNLDRRMPREIEGDCTI